MEVGERVKVAGLEAAPGVLDEMEVLDQQVAPVGTFADHVPDIRPGRVVEDPAFRVRRRLAAPGSRMNFTLDEPSRLAGLPDLKLRHWVALVSIFPWPSCDRRLSAFLGACFCALLFDASTWNGFAGLANRYSVSRDRPRR